METEERKKRLNELYYTLLTSGKVTNKKDLAQKLGISYAYICNSFGVDKRFPTPKMLRMVEELAEGKEKNTSVFTTVQQIPLLPIEARGGTLNEYSEGVMSYQCEKITTPIKGADFCIQVTGDSMAPDYPSGCHVFIKKVDSSIFIEWGKVYVLDTANGIVIKEVHPTNDDEVIQCVSINPKYSPYHIRKEYIYGWYSVLMTMALK
jgi:phage repressor protein C with HTH and peptisase S24 domain